MKRFFLWLACMAAVVGLCACFGQETTAPYGEQDTETGGQSSAGRDFTRPEIGAPVELDPPYDFDPEKMLPRDFGDYFTTDWPVEVSSYPLAQGTDVENEVFVIRGEEEGPAIYIIAGVHGDEMAGWMAGNLLKKATIRAGSLYILSPANPWGAGAEPRSRYVTTEEDLNRSFPGREDGTMAERTARSIYEDVARVNPTFLFDLHEARFNTEARDFLGSSLIFTSLDKMEQLCIDLLLATESGQLCSERFNFFGPGPKGSVNHTITTELGIPVLTVETYRGYPLERRIGDQLALIDYTLAYYGLL